MKWDGNYLADIVKERLYSLLWKKDVSIALTMSNKEYAAFLKSVHSNAYCNASNGGGDTPTITGRTSGIIIEFTDRTFDDGGKAIEIPWSMAAHHIRAWEYEKAHGDTSAVSSVSGLSKVQDQWDRTHLCGDRYNNNICEFFLKTDSKDTTVNGKKLDRSCYYCTSENKIRKIGSGGSWTGLSPKFCPKRKALEQHTANGKLFENSEQLMDEGWRYAFSESSAPLISKIVHGHNEKEEDNTMARKMQFDTAIAKDMQAAASDSFIDNIKMIDIDDINPNDENFYEMSDIELLADDIERVGLKHNLVVVKAPDCERYTVKSGHRRLAAIKLLIEQKRCRSTKIPCIVDGHKTQAEEQFDLIMLNATQRKYSDADVLHEYEELEKTFKALENEGKPLKGRIRDNIAKVLNVSPAQVGKMENIKHNAIPEVEKAVKSGAMSISTANEVAKLSAEKQQEIIKETPKISHKEIKEIQKQEKPKPVVPPKVESSADDSFEDDLGDSTEADNTEKELVFENVILSLSVKEAKVLLNFINENIAYADDEDSITNICGKLEMVTDDL
ncbi:MAG: ParB/RepB/Spo0J family partition protein [Oscillospiraceae bacterium]